MENSNKPLSIPRAYVTFGDLAIFALLLSAIYAVFSMAELWSADYHPVVDIDLSISALPKYALFSLMRGIAAYFISLIATFVIGYTAARNRLAESILIPLVDIFQSLPVLAFLPGLVLGLIALFPTSNVGLELAAIIMIFTSQAWNMIFAFYTSLKSIPDEFNEVAKLMGLTFWQRFRKLELPFSAVNLTWNSLLSMAGGWFFLTVCEAFSLGDKQFQLPGIGSYMALAISQNDQKAILAAIAAMFSIIIFLDVFVWRPLLSWVARFRIDALSEEHGHESLIIFMFRESRLFRRIKFFYNRQIWPRLKNFERQARDLPESPAIHVVQKHTRRIPRWFFCYLEWAGVVACVFALIYFSKQLGTVLLSNSWTSWSMLLHSSLYTFLRVSIAVAFDCLWTIPFGIWIGLSATRTRIFQPIIQILASFPAPMVFPLALTLFFDLGLSFEISSMLLMAIGVQWYILFNVIAGTLRVPRILDETMTLMGASIWHKFKELYLPSIYPSLITGCIAAAGGAWNASIVSEYLLYKGETLKAHGLGAALRVATESGDLKTLATGIFLMVSIILVVNKLLWGRLATLGETRYKMEM